MGIKIGPINFGNYNTLYDINSHRIAFILFRLKKNKDIHIQPINLSINQSINQSVNQPITQSINHCSHQTINF